MHLVTAGSGSSRSASAARSLWSSAGPTPRAADPISGRCCWGYYTEDARLHYAGRVGTGMTEKELKRLADELKPLHVPRRPLGDHGHCRSACRRLSTFSWMGTNSRRRRSMSGPRPALWVVTMEASRWAFTTAASSHSRSRPQPSCRRGVPCAFGRFSLDVSFGATITQKSGRGGVRWRGRQPFGAAAKHTTHFSGSATRQRYNSPVQDLS
jgi:hypothetical protein